MKRVLRYDLSDWFSNQPVRRKLAWLALVAALIAAIAASLAILAHHLILLRTSYRADALSISRIVAENAIGPVAFHDEAAATAVLSSLRAKPSIRGAVIDLPNEPNFAVYGEFPPDAPRLLPGTTDGYDGWVLRTTAPIGDYQVGTVHITSDLRPFVWETIRVSAFAVAVGLLLAVVLSGIASKRLRSYILAPVETLHNVAARVAEKADYQERAPVLGRDEMGQLTATFNRMLDRLEENDAALRASNEVLAREIENRQRLESQLIETSRLAGMAEVATSVLHNVGNVLNSVNVSAQLMGDKLRADGHFRLVDRLVVLLREKREDLPRYIAEDPRGKHLPEFLLRLAEQGLTMQQELLRETNALSHNIEHIKQVVSVQQKYARISGVMVSVAPAELFDSAVSLIEVSLTREGVEVTRLYQPAPDIITDRGQVIQILVNFLTNGVQAVKSRPAGERRLRLTLESRDKNVEFAVEDNGVGIPPENLGRIFQHGFTTRKDGHGFGLHSGALAAKNLHGQVSVHSDGSDRGARFSLSLPISTPNSQSRNS